MVSDILFLGLSVLASPLFVSSAVIPTTDTPTTDIPATNIHNCSGEASLAPTTYAPYFSTYVPQITGDVGWEEWTWVLPDQNNQSMFHFRWTSGDPAVNASDPTNGTFSVFYEKTGFRAAVQDSFVSNVVEGSFVSISVGNNTLLFDGTVGQYGMWNASLDIQGFKLDGIIDPATPSVPFEPSLDGKEGVLVPGYNVSHPVYRGHTNVTVTLPSGLSWYTLQVSTLKHAHGYGAVQDLLSSYTRVTTFVGPSSLNWYTATDKSGADTTAAQFVYGTLDLSAITLKYQVTNEPSILNISSSVSTDAHDYAVTFAGCNDTLDNPYTFNSTSGVYLGVVTDSAGGNTEYWSLTTNVLFYVDGEPWTNNATVGSLGILEVYTSP